MPSWVRGALVVLAGVLSTTASDSSELGSCQGLSDDDCVVGYTSLLQEKMSLVGQKIAAQSSTKSQKAVALSGKAARQDSLYEELLITWYQGSHDSLWLCGGFILAGLVFWLACLRPAISAATGNRSGLQNLVNPPDNTEEMEQRIHDSLEEDTYSLAICVLVRDLRSISLGDKSNQGLKYSRIVFGLALVLTTVGIQIAIVACTKIFVTPLQVADIRDAYDTFEQKMYGSHTYLNENGKARGMAGYFNQSAFDTLTDDEKTNACNIPFSQLNWFMLVLLIWTITCMASLKKCFETFMALIVFAPTKSDMKDCLTFWEDAIQSDEPAQKKQEKTNEDRGINVQVITGVTLPVKVLLTFVVFLPEFLTTSYILWLGSRWLAATNDFGNIVSNAVALEFTLQLKCLLFYALASERNKRDLERTGIAPPWGKEAAGYGVYFNTLYWALLSAAWVYLYIFHFQRVLLDYKWDVHQVCDPWLGGLLSKSAGSGDSGD
jgi:hypothetical protein